MPPRRKTGFAVAAAVVAVLVVLCVVFAPSWLVGTAPGLGPADDVTAAIAAPGRGGMIEPGAGSELERVDLRGADLTGLAVPRVCFAGANLEGGVPRNADLAGATLTGTLLRDADLRGADLTGADLTDADLTGARTDGVTRWPEGFTPPA